MALTSMKAGRTNKISPGSGCQQWFLAALPEPWAAKKLRGRATKLTIPVSPLGT